MNKKYEQTIKISTQFDPQELLDGLKEIQKQVKAMSGVKPEIFTGVAKDIEAAEKAGQKLTQALKKGVSSDEEVKNLKDLNKEFEKLAATAKSSMSAAISQGFRQAQGAIKDGAEGLKQQIEAIRKNIQSIISAANEETKNFSIKLGRNTLNLGDALSQAKDLKAVEKIINGLQLGKNKSTINLATAYEDEANQVAELERRLEELRETYERLQATIKDPHELENLREEFRKVTSQIEQLEKASTLNKFVEYYTNLSNKKKASLSEKLPTQLLNVNGNISEENLSQMGAQALMTLATGRNKSLDKIVSSFSSGLVTVNGGSKSIGDFLQEIGTPLEAIKTFFTEIFKIPAGDKLAELTARAEELRKQMDAAIDLGSVEAQIENIERTLPGLREKLAEYKQELDNASKPYDDGIALAEQVKTQMAEIADKERQIKEGKEETNRKQQELNQKERETTYALEEQGRNIKRNTEALGAELKQLSSFGKVIDNVNSTFNQLSNRLSYFVSIFTVFRRGRQVIRQTFQDVQNLDKAFSSIAMVTSNTVQGLWKSYSTYADIANKLGQSTTSAIEASALYYQQGLKTNEVLSLTESTLKLATLSQQNFETTTKQLTAALRGFNMEMSEADNVTDVYSELAAHAAADVQGIAYSMSKVASIASSSGASFANTAAFLTQMIN